MSIEKVIYDLIKISGLSRREIIKKLEDLKSSPIKIKKYFLFTGEFPEPKMDEFMKEHSFEVLEYGVKKGIIKL
ncbi:hypothetical protein [Tenacibaculum ovolyticum]|uniref:hypothetical protein n=1 Tax=Tenacibaculum ovolyticum TaxID=104270 RepID=UPI0007ED4791|nr:hypothetical protein [Tenacibaculum ovolyticum]